MIFNKDKENKFGQIILDIKDSFIRVNAKAKEDI